MDDFVADANVSILEEGRKPLHNDLEALARAPSDMSLKDTPEAEPPSGEEQFWSSVILRLSGRAAPGQPRVDLDATRVTRTSNSQDCIWGVTIDHRVVGLVSIRHEGRHRARIAAFRVHPEWQQTAVVAKLIDRVHQECWNRGYLKVVLEAHVAPALVRSMLEHRGFHLVRRRQVLDQEWFEYYVDLYHAPRHEAGATRS